MRSRARHVPAVALLGLLVACKPPAAPSPDPVCPQDMLLVSGGTFELGEGDDPEEQPNQVNAVIRRGTFTVESFCIETFPFPGRDGAEWPSDGLSHPQAAALDALVAQHGRRLCSTTELLLAAAGPGNWRYPYSAEARSDGICDPSDTAPQPLGTFEGCSSPTGGRDFLVRSAWARLDAPMRTHMATYGAPNRPPHVGGGMPDVFDYAVYGGVGRTDTFYASTNFGAHGHNADEGQTLDDSTRICRDPEPISIEQEGRYAALVDGFIAGESSYADLLAR